MSIEIEGEVILNSSLFAGVRKSNGDYKSHTTTPCVSPNQKQAVRNGTAAANAKAVLLSSPSPILVPVRDVALVKVITCSALTLSSLISYSLD
jgi:hypothetical protein